MPTSSRTDAPRVLVLHAYSPTNSGDGLLVDLALGTLRRAIGDFHFHVIASDADGFGDNRYLQWGLPLLSRPGPMRRVSMLATGALGAPRHVRKLAAEADLIVAVGGAYLRGGGTMESVKSWGAHYGQLKLAAEHGQKTIYLPQSIGPFSGHYRRSVDRQLSRIRTVYVRDERSLSDWGHLEGVKRAPDMAILEWARGFSGPVPLTNEAPVFVARPLSQPRKYQTLLEAVRESGQFEWAVQATGGGNDDFPITRHYSPTEPRLLSAILREKRPRVVVSTRLHGSLSSLIAGYPSIHLSYERKGWSAFADLGLSDFVLSARDATMSQIRERLQRISDNPAAYWALLASNVTKIGVLDRAIEDQMRQVVAGSRRDGDLKVGR